MQWNLFDVCIRVVEFTLIEMYHMMQLVHGYLGPHHRCATFNSDNVKLMYTVIKIAA